MRYYKVFIVICLLCLGIPSIQAQTTSQETQTAVTVDELLADAMKYIGRPYHYGGKGPNSFDCAGFTRFVYSHFGVSLSPSAPGQYNQVSEVVKREDLQKGDLVFFGGRGHHKSVGHVGIVTEVGEDQFFFIHACSRGVRISPSTESYYVPRYIGARRVLHFATASALIDTLSNMAINEPDSAKAADSVNATELAAAVVDSTAAVQDSSRRTYSIAMVGDMMLGTTYPEKQLPKNDGKNLFDDVRELLVNADIAAGNLEGPICAGGVCSKSGGPNSYAFRMPPAYVQRFVEAGFDFLSMANNHVNDFHAEGMKSTMALLDSAGISYAGVRNVCQSAIREHNGVRYGFCAFSPNNTSCSILDTSAIVKILRSLRDSVDILIVSFHGGAEGKQYTHVPMGKEYYLNENRGDVRAFAHLCIDRGADVVFGHGPHVCRGIEAYNGHFIAYSLGNFCTPAGINVAGINGYAPVITINIDEKGLLVDGRIHSFIQPFRTGPRIDPANKVAQQIRKLSQEDFKNSPLVIEEDGSFKIQ